MTDLSAFPITKKWPARHPDRIQLYSLPTPNGVKVSIMLEETGLAYEPHRVSFDTNDQMSPEFLSLSPNNKIPAIIDPDGPGGKPLGLFESGAILVYLADKSGQLMPRDAAGRYEAIQWLMFQMGGIGPMLGQAQVPLLAPMSQVRRVEALSPKEGSDRPRFVGRIRLCQNALLILRGELPALRSHDDFRVGPDCVFHRLRYCDLTPLRGMPNRNGERCNAIDLLLHGGFLLRPQQ